MMDAKKQAQNYLEKLLALKDEDRTQIHDKHAREIEYLRQKHAQDLEQAKASLSDLHEQKVEYLSEAKEEA